MTYMVSEADNLRRTDPLCIRAHLADTISSVNDESGRKRPVPAFTRMQEDKFSGFLVVYHKGQFWMAKMVVHQKGHFWRVKKVPNIPLELHAIQYGYRTACLPH